MTPRSLRDCPRIQPDLNGTGLTKHPVLGGLDRASRPIAPNPAGCSALTNRQTGWRRLGLARSCQFSARWLNGVGGLFCPFIRREKGSARDDFQGENRGPMVQDVPSGRSQRRRERQYGLPARQEVLLRSRRASGGFLNEGSAQRRIGMGRTNRPLH
jgi:hypothetical protein